MIFAKVPWQSTPSTWIGRTFCLWVATFNQFPPSCHQLCSPKGTPACWKSFCIRMAWSKWATATLMAGRQFALRPWPETQKLSESYLRTERVPMTLLRKGTRHLVHPRVYPQSLCAHSTTTTNHWSYSSVHEQIPIEEMALVAHLWFTVPLARVWQKPSSYVSLERTRTYEICLAWIALRLSSVRGALGWLKNCGAWPKVNF